MFYLFQPSEAKSTILIEFGDAQSERIIYTYHRFFNLHKLSKLLIFGRTPLWETPTCVSTVISVQNQSVSSPILFNSYDIIST